MPPATQPDRNVFTISELTAQVREMVEGVFPSVWVTGEISNYTRAASGHAYFTLKDARAQLRSVLFRGVGLRLKFDPKDGLEVLARGRLTVYEPRGDYQLQVEEMQPKGVGAAELGLRQLKEKLLAKGYFDPHRKKPLPRFPKRVALVASASGAAVRDMIELLAKRWPLAEVIVRPSRVQGEGAAEEVAIAVRLLNRLHKAGRLPLDAIVIGRGGGSAEDLWAFNEEAVADALFQSVVPVVSAVGHEIDVTVADLVADYRAETPSAAVVALTPHRDELMAGLEDFRDRFRDAVEHRLRLARQKLDHIASRPALRRPLQRIQELEQRLDDAARRLHRAAGARLAIANERLAGLTGQLETLSPLNVLRRGYSLTRTDEGRLVRDSTEVRPGDRVVTRVANGEITSRVEQVQEAPTAPLAESRAAVPPGS